MYKNDFFTTSKITTVIRALVESICAGVRMCNLELIFVVVVLLLYHNFFAKTYNRAGPPHDIQKFYLFYLINCPAREKGSATPPPPPTSLPAASK